ncbi:glycosyltransferase [Hyphomicrobium facile]|uniref:Glycosyltransferase involved in cell wall bisynthesis n=1 Tax=Hyphomicrobium facile TaxID=51670 RepID=A0A1I7NDH6_9HYPH|nr:glycosyltransferase [Hyphomicrobium facile]SFV32720.1 Glycosyltransferase involved in cell wall bisynthesis [Hyphomicrobium facile]
MRIALTVDPELPVPPMLYGGIERIVDMLALGLVKRGHEVTVFAHPESKTGGSLIAWPGQSSRSNLDTLLNAAVLARGIAARKCEIVHSFSRVAYMALILPLTIPKLMTYQREISARSVRLGHGLSRGSLEFSGISRWMARDVEHLARWHLVPNGVPVDVYDFASAVAPDAPFVFLGRIEAIKGPHLAIELARRAGRRLILAGNIPDEHRAWFATHIAGHIDGDQVIYVGPVNDRQKSELLGKAAALLMPILWDEPFGIVMAEAMACGTPVLGLRRGAVPEVVEDGVTGFVVDTLDELVIAAGRIGQIARSACRDRVKTFYSEPAVLDGYLEIYAEMIARRDGRMTT